jgi:hypothetical protein
LGLPAVPPGGPTYTGFGIFSQTLGSAQFTIMSASATTPLLSGTIGSAFMTGILGFNAGSLVSSQVVYSSGLILDAAEGLTPGATPSPMYGQLSWSLLNADRPFDVPTGGILSPFGANATGQFSAPELGTGLMLLSGAPIVFFAYRRRRMAAGAK